MSGEVVYDCPRSRKVNYRLLNWGLRGQQQPKNLPKYIVFGNKRR